MIKTKEQAERIMAAYKLRWPKRAETGYCLPRAVKRWLRKQNTFSYDQTCFAHAKRQGLL